MPDSNDRLLLNLSEARLHIHLAALDTHDKEIVEEMRNIRFALQTLSRKVDDQRIGHVILTGALTGAVTLLPSECADCANGIKHPHPVVRKES